MIRSIQTTTLAFVLGAGFVVTPVSPLEARGGHHFGMQMGGHGMHGGGFSGGGRRGNSPYIKAASNERDKLLSKLKSICRGC